jgi:hypothetical protein
MSAVRKGREEVRGRGSAAGWYTRALREALDAAEAVLPSRPPSGPIGVAASETRRPEAANDREADDEVDAPRVSRVRIRAGAGSAATR